MESSGGSESSKAVYLSAQKVTIGAIVAFLFLIFGGIVVFASKYSTSGTVEATPTPVPDGLYQAGADGQFQAKPQQQQPDVKGTQTQTANIPQPTLTPKPTATPKATPSPSATPTPTPSPTPTPTASSSSTSEPTPTPTPTPTSTPTPEPTVTPTPTPTPSD